MTVAQLLPIVLLALPAAALALWPLLRGAGAERELPEAATAKSGATDRRLELGEERRAIYRALRELDFDHEAGHLSEDDYHGLRNAYEVRAAGVLRALDALGAPAARPGVDAPRAVAAAARRGWTRNPLALGAGAVSLLAFGVLLGVSVGRYTEPDSMPPAPGASVTVPPPPDAMAPGAPSPGPVSPGAPADAGTGPARLLSPEMLAGMLEAARQSLFAGRYAEAIAAYQAVLKRDPRNVNAMSHLGYIVALGGMPTPRWRRSTRRWPSTRTIRPPTSSAGRCSPRPSTTPRAPRSPGSASSCSSPAAPSTIRSRRCWPRPARRPLKATR